MSDAALRILAADDDANMRLLLHAALRKAGFDVALANNGIEALQKFRAERYDLVVLDVDMPQMGGYEACAILRAEAGALLPIVVVTGMDDLASIERAYESGATDFIAKPVNWALLGHRIRYMLRGYQNLLALRLADERNAAVLGAIPDELYELDLEGRCFDYHAPHAEPRGARANVAVGRTVAESLPTAAAEVCMAALRAALEHGSCTGRQFELPGAAGSRWFELSVARKAGPPGQLPRFIVLSRDITERKEAELHIARLAYFDSLTGLPNRQSFLDRLEREIRRACQDGRRIAVLFMDLDGFKNVNDSLGHGAGDLMLKWAATRLGQGLRPADVLARTGAAGDDANLARLGGDEFAALLLDVGTRQDALNVAMRVGQLMRRPFHLQDRAVTLTISIGVAVYPDDGQDATAVLKHADTAMYHAKDSGRDNAKLYSAMLTERAMQNLELNNSLRAALGRQEFHLVYQPQVDLRSGRACSVEALIRWNHPTRGAIAPLEFLHVAEDCGLIEDIGRWVLDTACTDAARWNRAGPAVTVAVNLSPVQLRDPQLVPGVIAILARTGLAPELLELEITEGSLMENPVASIAKLQALRDHGVHIALDDFGTGYSSLGYLTQMPIGHLKVDRCFVSGLLTGGPNAGIVRAVLAMASGLGMRVTAEGVETVEQARALHAMACDAVQGYFLSVPVAADAIPALLQRQWVLDCALPQGAPAGAECGTNAVVRVD